MKKIFSFICLYFLTISPYARCEIKEIENFELLTQYILPETLLLLDIDDTLLIPVQTLGTDVWFQYRIKQNHLKMDDHSAAFQKALAEWEAVRHLTQMKIVETGTDKIIETLQKEKSVIMGLTTQGLALTTRTLQQLQSLNIDLSATSPSQDDCYFINGQGVLYRKGVLFTSGTPKGEALLKFLDTIEYQPKQIVFINDKLTHLQDVETSVSLRGIPFTGLRYNYCDQRITNFNPEIANIQWIYSSFGHLLSDEEAEEVLKHLLKSISENF